jgi:hypothetical protein
MSELDHWKERLSKGAVSRREFIERAAALGVSSLAISQMLASADAIAAETPKKGGLLRLGLGGGSTTDSIDVTTYTDAVMVDVGHALPAPGLVGAATTRRNRRSSQYRPLCDASYCHRLLPKRGCSWPHSLRRGNERECVLR